MIGTNSFTLMILLLALSFSALGGEAKNYSNISNFEKDMKLYYEYTFHEKYREQFKRIQIARLRIYLDPYISNYPEVLLRLYEKNPELTEQFVKKPFVGLVLNNRLDKVMCELVRKVADKIEDSVKKKKFLIACLVDRYTCGGTRYTLQLWNEMRRIPAHVDAMPKTGNLIYSKIQHLVAMLDDFKNRPNEIARDVNLYVGCFKASKVGVEIPHYGFVFDNSPAKLLAQESRFCESFKNAVNSNKKAIKLDLPKLLHFISEEGGQRDSPGSRGLLESITYDERCASVQIVAEDRKSKSIRYIFSFPIECSESGNTEFYLGKVILDEKNNPMEIISMHVCPQDKDFKAFIQTEIYSIIKRYRNDFEDKYKYFKKLRMRRIELEYEESLKDEDLD